MQTVSIVTTTRNRKPLLKKTIESVLRQDYPSIEHIVIDALSNDGTQELLKSYEAAYQKKGYTLRWISEKDKSQAQGMNKGFPMVTGDFMVLLNDDDWLIDDSVSKYVAAFHEHPEVDFIYGSEVIEYGDGHQEFYEYRPYSFRDVIYYGYSIPQSQCMFRSRLAREYGTFDESLHYAAELELFLRFWKHGIGTLYLPHTPLQVVFEHGGRKTVTGNKGPHRETMLVILRNGGSRFSPYYIVYLKNMYFAGFFEWLKNKFPGVYAGVKNSFNKLTRSS